MKEIKENTNRWRNIPCSWIGRINIVKMSISLSFHWLINNIRLVLPQFFSPCGKELKQHTSYISSRQDVLGKQQEVHSVGLRVEQSPQEWPCHFGFSLPLFLTLSRFLGPDWLHSMQIGEGTYIHPKPIRGDRMFSGKGACWVPFLPEVPT